MIIDDLIESAVIDETTPEATRDSGPNSRQKRIDCIITWSSQVQ
jgi:hypothetical protein